MRRPNPRLIGLRDDAMTVADACSGKLAKLREAYEFADEFLRDYGTDWKLHNKLCDMLKSALAEPLRNCDIGTAEEQYERWWAFCAKHGDYCMGCPCGRPTGNLARCFAKWAQMPYSDD